MTRLKTMNPIYGTGANSPATGQYLLWDKNLSSYSYNTYNSPTMLTPPSVAPPRLGTVASR